MGKDDIIDLDDMEDLEALRSIKAGGDEIPQNEIVIDDRIDSNKNALDERAKSIFGNRQTPGGKKTAK
jgi:hypothetical protein